MTSYLVTIVTDHHQTCLKMRARDKRTATENFRSWCFRKKIQKNLRGVATTPLPLVVRGLIRIMFSVITVDFPYGLWQRLIYKLQENKLALLAGLLIHNRDKKTVKDDNTNESWFYLPATVHTVTKINTRKILPCTNICKRKKYNIVKTVVSSTRTYLQLTRIAVVFASGILFYYSWAWKQ